MKTLKQGSKGVEVIELQQLLNLQADGIFGPLTKEAVQEFQKENGLVPDGIVGINTWNKLNEIVDNGQIYEFPSILQVVKNNRNIKEILVHCSATPEGKDFTVSDIKRWHLERGFSDIGYHYVIYRDGSIHFGRSEAIAGAHCTNHNSISIGICYIGGCEKDGVTPKDTRTQFQKESLLKLLKALKVRYPKAIIHSHKDFANKACPSFDATREYKNL